MWDVFWRFGYRQVEQIVSFFSLTLDVEVHPSNRSSTVLQQRHTTLLSTLCKSCRALAKMPVAVSREEVKVYLSYEILLR
jgi:hypothetical protein